jgi:hypothetical protein
MLKERADLVLSGERGDGVEELIDRLLADDRRLEPGITTAAGARNAFSRRPA